MESLDEFLEGGDELFQAPRFVNHYNFMLNEYIPIKEKPIAFFLSCSKHKPYYKSPYRRVFYAMLDSKLKIRDISQIYTISEPAIVVPEEFDDTKITKYEFPPSKMKQEGKDIFIKRLSNILPKLIKAHEYLFYILPKHHRSIFEKAINEVIQNEKNKSVDTKDFLSRIIYAPPLTYNLPKTRVIIENTLKKNNY